MIKLLSCTCTFTPMFSFGECVYNLCHLCIPVIELGYFNEGEIYIGVVAAVTAVAHRENIKYDLQYEVSRRKERTHFEIF